MLTILHLELDVNKGIFHKNRLRSRRVHNRLVEIFVIILNYSIMNILFEHKNMS